MTCLFRQILSLAFALQICVGVAGCDTLSIFDAPGISERSTGSITPRPIHLQSGEKVRVVVFGEDKLNGDYEIDPVGMITVPLVGSIQAAGLTKQELEQALKQKLRKDQILRNPVVTVDVAAFRPFYVLGEVEKPGQYAFNNGLNVMSAVAVAGGYTYRASKSRVLVQRAGEKTFTAYALSPDVQIFPGDLISVPERYF